jgi:hypothetical protein
MIAQTLKQQSAANGLGWDDNMIGKMSAGIVGGLHDWHN